MVSKRKFFSIATMMFVLFFLFQFSMVLRDSKNTYDINSSLTEKKADGRNRWTPSDSNSTTVIGADSSVVFVGNEDGDMGTAVSRWCTYAKRKLISCKSVRTYKSDDKNLPEMMILESEKYADGDNLTTLETLEKKGVIIVFGCLENAKNIQNNKALMKFLGIQKVVAEETHLAGVKLFEGLLLGGEVTYNTSKDKEEKKRQDLELDVPWYQVGSGTKTYMVGLLDEKTGKNVENEDLPTIIWRNGIDYGSVFAVVGDYMKDSTALGLLDGMRAETLQYTIYPIVNAQNLSMVNFPVFADENNTEMLKLYSQSVTGIARDIMWPALISVVEKSDMKMTCFIQPQADYTDDIEPKSGNLEFYLKQMKEQSAEAGISLEYQKLDKAEDKVTKDTEFFENEKINYRFGAAFAKEKDLKGILKDTDSGLLGDVGTLVCDYTENQPVVSYYSDSVTLQTVTSDGMNYAYSDDIRMRSIQTALGYTNVMLDMYDIFWPQEKTDRWEVMQKRFSSNLLTYWKNFRDFDSTTLSESNARIRTFLNLAYSQSREDNTITLQTSEAGSWFILRTHGEEIDEIDGGSQTEIEADAYLICAEDTTVKIRLKEQELYYDTRKN
ncbi:DUF2194 domain-containing protein [Blautia sp. MSK17_66]|uniref:DUF2194 domain-containing protein n=1 Tax=Blautia TaxID=572511 RepID=UPI00156D888E|nr:MULTISPECIES: DUF2194 domain-containing protein [Blautia]MCB5550581.1 DUF2194 domain-containing protein [Blautia sp. MSK17_66]NSK02166.1 DUF2194 domain-containing protein [Blautia obeum]